MSEPAKFSAPDHYTLGGVAFAPEAPAKAIAVIAPAMAVLQRAYRAFAAHLADQGIAALTFDYRGIGESRPPTLRGFHATATQWGTHDLAAAIDHARARFGPDRPTFVIGHSIGGQVLGLCPRAPSLAGAVLVAAQSGYWKMWSGLGRALMFTHWHLMPWVSRAVGYLPMRLARQGEDVPLGVALEWATWGRHPDYLLSSELARREQGHLKLAIPMRAYVIADDGYAPERSVQALAGFYAAARPEVKVLTPEELGTRRIGHFGIFRREFRETFYADVVGWIKREASA